MRCRSCGYLSLERAEVCKNCGASQAGAVTVPGEIPGAPPRPAASGGSQLEFGFEIERPAPASQVRRRRRMPPRGAQSGRAVAEEVPEGGGVPLPVDSNFGNTAGGGSATTHEEGGRSLAAVELFQDPPAPEAAAPAPVSAAGGLGDGRTPPAESRGDLARPDSVLRGEERAPAPWTPADESGEERPESARCPEAAGLGRRAAALLVDQMVLAAILGSFFFSAFLALRVSGFDTDHFLSAAGLLAAKEPFALLFVFLSLVYHAYFHGSTGRTPGKALAGIAVLTGDGAVASGPRAILRWLCAALGLACAGLGLAWALFDPDRRGWADRLSGTVVARVSGGPSAGPPRR